VINITKAIEKICIEIILIAGHLLAGIILIVGRKIRAEGKPGITHLGSWLKKQGYTFTRNSIASAKPPVIKAGQISKTAIVAEGTKLKSEGGPNIISTAHHSKQRSAVVIGKSKEIIAQRSSKNFKENMDEELRDENLVKNSSTNIPTSDSTPTIPTEVVINNDYTFDIGERFAKEIMTNGITCYVIRNLESIQIEMDSCYSYLLPTSPRIVTSRTCIWVDNCSSKNISLIQIIQRN
jgi:hypothetical protein